MHHPHGSRAKTKAALSLTVAATLMLSGAYAASAATTNPSPSSLELADAQLSKSAATQGMVLLENHQEVGRTLNEKNPVLPLAKTTNSAPTNVALFGVGGYATIKGGTGSGNVNNRYTINARTGLQNAGFNVTTSPAYWNALSAAWDAKYGSGAGSVLSTIDPSSVEQPLTADSVKPTVPTDTAVYVLARSSGEGADRKNAAGDYLLSATEADNLQRIGQTYTHVIVVLNTGGIIDTNFFNQINAAANDPDGGKPLDAMLLMSQAGEESGNALAEVLDGDVDPSGKLTDTWASSYSYYPASGTFGANDANTTQENYNEGVYVGYRYFDSFAKTLPANAVTYPFGYGLSYSDFQIDTQSVTADTKSVVVKAKVTNVGKATGKEVVQTYFSAPQTGIDKPYQELAGYAKTDDLVPGASQVVTITYDTTQMSSYNTAKAQYVMDAGDYLIRVGDSSRNTHVAAKINLAAPLVTEQLSNELTDPTPTPQPALTELTSNPANFYSYPKEAQEITDAPSMSLNTIGFVTPNDASPYQQTNTVDSTSPYYALDGSKISSSTAYVDPNQMNWEGTGAKYQAKTGETITPVATDPTTTLYDVAKGSKTIQQFVAGLSVTQLANIVEGATTPGSTLSATGAAGYTTAKYESLGIPGMTLSDGPAGLRLTQQINTTPKTYQYETAWPIGTLLAQTWDRDLVQQVGNAIGKEMEEAGVTLWLAPGMNIHRDPLNGRNFEYYSEDPLVAGLTSAATTEGVQSNPGVGVTIKHFAANNQEANRNAVNETISERALREIYLKGFEISVKTAQPMAIMTSYNRINGVYSSANYDMVTNVLHGEWGFKGLVMSDWGGSHGALNSMYAGNDLIEPGNNQAEVINATLKVPPTIDYNGVPAYNQTSRVRNGVTTLTDAFTLGGLTLSATGAQSITTTVDGTTNLSQTPLSTITTTDAINNQIVTPVPVYGSVAGAYAAAQALLAPSNTAVNATQKAAITIVPTYQTAGDSTTPVVSYTVTVKGDYAAAGYNMRLGDLQRSAINILNIVKQTAQFQQLAGIQGVTGITSPSYEAQFTNLPSFASYAKSVVKLPVGPAPAITVTAGTPVPASGWYKSAVTFTASAADEEGTYLSYEIDNGQVLDYTPPIKISGDGVHSLDVFGTAANDLPARITTTVKIDGTPPTTSAAATAGKLTLSAKDEGSGVASIQYSVNGGAWSTYTTPVVVAGLVQYKATDKAGNVSAKSINVTGVLTLGKPVIKGTALVGSKLTATATVSPAGATLAYQWLRNGKAIAGATKSTYTLVAADAVTKLSVKVTAGKKYYANATATSAAVTVVGKLVLSTPLVKGTATVGHVLTGSVATHTAGATLSYQWLRNGAAISGGTKSTHSVVAADKGKKLTVKVTEKKAGYLTVTLTSAATTIK